MAEHGGGFVTPAEAGRRIGIAPSTVRIYSVKLARLLSDEAGRAPTGPGGRPGVRLYSEEDVRVLTAAKEMLGRGLTYEQVAESLGGDARGKRSPTQCDSGGRRSRGPRESEFLSLLEPLKASLDRAVEANEAWRLLAEERGREVEALRSRIVALEEELARMGRRRSTLGRLFGG